MSEGRKRRGSAPNQDNDGKHSPQLASESNRDAGPSANPPSEQAPRQKKYEELSLPPYYPPAVPTLLFVLSGPSGVGKDAVISRLKENDHRWHFTVTVTTRPPRPGEVHGQSYFFVTQEQFEEMKRRNELLEWAVVHGYCYGTPRDQVREALRAGKDAFLKIDVQGAAQVKRRVPGAVFIFLGPENMACLINRLTQRGTESPEQLETRVRNAYEEMHHLPEYDYLVINPEQRLEEAVELIECIVAAEKSKVKPRKIEV